jgi:hypothetical protein
VLKFLISERDILFKIIKKFFAVWLLLTASLWSQEIEIKSLKYYTADEISLPVMELDLSPPQTLKIEFDLNANVIPNLNIIFRFCDIDWNPVDNIFLLNIGQNTSYNLDFERLPTIIEGARYHYKGFFPNNKDVVSFPFSGKWMFFIADSYDTSVVYETGRFYAVRNDVNLKSTLKREQLEDKTYFPADLAKVFNLTTNFDLPEEFTPSFVNYLEIIENKKLDDAVIVDRQFNTNTRQFYWNGAKKFSFIARDLRPGNGYRQVDLRDFNIFNRKDVNAKFDGIEYSRFFKKPNPNLKGSFLLTNYKSEFADYLNVTFSIRPPEEFTGSIFLTGAFNHWRILPHYEMKPINGLYSITIPLKRGIYDYQYVTADIINEKIVNEDWFYLEGNNWDTKNEYSVFLFYNDPQYGGYDRITGYQKLMSR